MTQPPVLDAQTPSQPPQVGYEFSSQQDDIIRVLAKRMKFVGIFYVIASGLLGLAGLIALFVKPLVGVIYLILLAPELLIGIWTINAASSFRLVIDTKGHDIPHLMNALTSLRRLYTLMYWLLIIGLVCMVLIIVAAIIFLSMGILPTGSAAYTSLRGWAVHTVGVTVVSRQT